MKVAGNTRVLILAATTMIAVFSQSIASAQTYSGVINSPVQNSNCKTNGTTMDFKLTWTNLVDPPIQSTTIAPKLLKVTPAQALLGQSTDITAGYIGFSIGAVISNGNQRSIPCNGTILGAPVAGDPPGTKYYFNIPFKNAFGNPFNVTHEIKLTD